MNFSNQILFSFLIFFGAFLSLEAKKKIIDLDQQTDYHEGDIVFKRNRNGILQGQKWTDGIVPYEFAPTWGEGYKRMVYEAFKEIQDHTCIKFVPRLTQPNYISIINHSGCYSSVGMQGGRQAVSLQDGQWSSCWAHGVIVHELLHAIGLWHEQSRYDRNDYITIKYDNIPKGLQYNFDIKNKSESDIYGVPYNYLSVMHYGKDAFSKNGQITIETRDKSMQDRIGHREHAVETDYEKVRRIYKCPGKFPQMPNPTPAPPTQPPPCIDEISYCKDHVDKCGRDQWTAQSCRKTCGLCTPRDEPTAAPAPCKDEVEYCYQYDKKCSSEGWMELYCRKTCKYC